MSQAAASIQVVTSHLPSAARTAAKADSPLDPAADAVDFSAVLAGQLGTGVDELKLLASAPLPGEAKVPDQDTALRDQSEPSVPSDALAALGLPVMPMPAPTAVEPRMAVRDHAFTAAEPAEPDAKRLDPSSLQAAVVAEARRGLPADLAAADVKLGAPAHDDVSTVPEGNSAPAALPAATSAEARMPQAVRIAAPAEQPIALNRAGFADEVGNRLTWMAAHGKQEAEIRLDPPHLGPLELKLTLAGDQASLSVVSAHAAVRDAVQNSVTRLQEMMQAVGVNLGQVFVGQGSQDQQARQDANANRPGRPARAEQEDVTPALALARAPLQGGVGLVDVFA